MLKKFCLLELLLVSILVSFSPANATSTRIGCVDQDGNQVPCSPIPTPTCNTDIGIGGCAPTPLPKPKPSISLKLKIIQMDPEQFVEALNLIGATLIFDR